MSTVSPINGRGASSNPPNRFIPIYSEQGPEWVDPEDPSPKTQFFRDESRAILATNNSPDIPFTYSLNPYRGCEHGCVYCYARPTHEYLSLSPGLDFETKILVKEDAPELLRKTFSSSKWVPQCVSISGVTDPYQPVERRLQLTRRCLQVFAEFRNPVAIVTKNALVTRDIDVLKELAGVNAAAVFVSVTSLDSALARVMEPRTSTPEARLRAIRELAQAGVPVGVMTAPVIPGLTDHEIPAILCAAAEAGARGAGYVTLRLPGAVADIFEQWLTQHFPARKEKVMRRLRSVRGGKRNDTRFGVRMRGEGEWAEVFARLFQMARKKAGIPDEFPELSAAAFRNPAERSLFD